MRAIHRVLLDSALRTRLRERGYEQAKRFSWDNSARRILKSYEQVAGTGETSQPQLERSDVEPAAAVDGSGSRP